MAERTETLTTDKSVDEALTAGTQTLESLGLTVAKRDAGSLEAKAGSAFMMYWIGLIAPESSVPVKVNYTVTESGGTRNVQMYTRSNVPLAFYFWRYKKRANTIADALAAGVGAKLGQSAPQPVG
jgi:hypothetical protein